ncbi:Histone-lysine N-methyltransferase set-6 [Diplodia seriata]|uniref:Histone-lysine N-methyltransferase set-6 n=1 Tax=Diplodia seriata TaxID=420778 RepID=A0ABR3C6K7_9PEZI
MIQVQGIPHGAPVSSLFAVQETPSAGRAVFATSDIVKGTPLWIADTPSANVILREYRRELCAYCFTYNRGREWKIRDNSVGFAFCSVSCQQQWMDALGEEGVQAWKAVEKLNKGCSREREMVDAISAIPTEDDIKAAWSAASAATLLILAARTSNPPPNKPARRALATTIQALAVPDVLSMLLSGILARSRDPHTWTSVLALWPNNRPYKSANDLKEHVGSLLQLVAVLPPSLLPFATPETCYMLATRDSMNSFGIRSLDDEGAEFFGYGVWTSASYFNHSCSPNVEKKRVGRAWHFTACRDVRKGEELCITYLSGEERALNTDARRKLLADSWGFNGRDDTIAGAKIQPLDSPTKSNVGHDFSDRGAAGTNHSIDQTRIDPLGGHGAKLAPLEGDKYGHTIAKSSGLDDEAVDGSRIKPLGEVREQMQ